MSDDDTYLETETDASNATGPSAAAILESIAGTLSKAPDGKRFDIEVVVEEREND